MPDASKMRYPVCPCFEHHHLERNIQIDEYCMKASAEFLDALDDIHLCDDATLFVIGALLSGYCVAHMTQVVGSHWTDRMTEQHLEHLNHFIDDAANHAKERAHDFLKDRMKRQ